MAHVKNNSGNNEWYTPPLWLDLARTVLGGEFDLDPASSEVANTNVRAAHFYTAEQDGLKEPWVAERLWMNPPYSRDLFPRFAHKLVQEVNAGNVRKAAVLTNNGTESEAGQLLLKHASLVLFPDRRIKFLGPDGKVVKTPLQGQMITFFGDNLNVGPLDSGEVRSYGVLLAPAVRY